MFADTAAGLNGDTIADLTFNETIVITDATLDAFAFNLTGNTLTYTGGSLTLSTPVNGRFIASAAAGGGVQLTIGSSLLPPIPQPPGVPNTGPLYIRESYSDPLPNYSIGGGSYISMLAQGGSSNLFPWGVATLTNAGTIYLEDAPGFSGDLRLAGGYDSISRFENSGIVVVHAHTPIAGNVIALQDNGSNGRGTYVNNSGQRRIYQQRRQRLHQRPHQLAHPAGDVFALIWAEMAFPEHDGALTCRPFAPNGPLVRQGPRFYRPRSDKS